MSVEAVELTVEQSVVEPVVEPAVEPAPEPDVEPAVVEPAPEPDVVEPVVEPDVAAASSSSDAEPPETHGDYPRTCWGVRLSRHGGVSAETLQLVEDLAVVKPRRQGDIVVEVTASAVNPVDWKIAKGDFESRLPELPHGLGIDFCGTVVFTRLTKRLKVGDRVYGKCDFKTSEDIGAFAQFVKTNELHAAIAPDNLSDIEAATMPAVFLTGWQAMHAGNVQPGHKVLILGGASGTGAAGIQLAKALGAATVVVTCSGAKAAFCQGLGADRCVDYRTDDWRQTLRGENFDLIYDCVGGVDSWDAASNADSQLLNPAGWFVTIAGDKPGEKINLGFLLSAGLTITGRKFMSLFPGHPNYSFVDAQSRYRELDSLRRLIEEGRLRPTIDTVYPLGRIWDALAQSHAGHVTGKIAIDCRSPIVPQPPVTAVQPAPIVDQPIVQEPVVDEPLVQEPVVDEPLVQEPEPVIEQPIVQEPEPVIEQPLVQEPEPVIEQPVEPVIEQPVVDEPIVHEPVVEPEPVIDEPVIDQPAIVEEPVIDEAIVADEPLDPDADVVADGDVADVGSPDDAVDLAD